MRFDLKRACKNCPFNNGPDRITFQCRERAEEIENILYRQGFVCHEHGEDVAVPFGDDEETHIDFRADGSSQHCFAGLAMHIKDGGSTVPWETACDADPELEERWWSRAEPQAVAAAFDSEEEFFEANEEGVNA